MPHGFHLAYHIPTSLSFKNDIIHNHTLTNESTPFYLSFQNVPVLSVVKISFLPSSPHLYPFIPGFRLLIIPIPQSKMRFYPPISVAIFI